MVDSGMELSERAA